MNDRNPRLLLSVGALMGVLILGGCSQAPNTSAPTVTYYRAHASERQSMVAKCADDPGELASSAACVNAQEAAALESVGSFRKLPPMGLPGAQAPTDGTPRHTPVHDLPQ